MRSYADPTFDSLARLERQSCTGCPFLERGFGDKWCGHPKYEGNESARPSTWSGAPRLHRCTEHPDGSNA